MESAHISGYTFERVCGELEFLLEDGRWQRIGPGYEDVNMFLKTIDLSAFNLSESRPKLVKRIKELEPAASQRAIAKAIGVGQATVHRDLSPDSDESPAAASYPTGHAECDEPDSSESPAWFQGGDVADLAKKTAKRKAKDGSPAALTPGFRERAARSFVDAEHVSPGEVLTAGSLRSAQAVIQQS